jgi:surface protein
MSLAFTFNNTSTTSTLTAGVVFTVTGGAKTCSYSDGITTFPSEDMTTGSPITITIPASTTRTLTFSFVDGVGTVTTFVVDGGEAFLTTVATANANWGMGSGGLTSFASTFDGCTTLADVPDAIPSTVTNLTSMFKTCTALADPDIAGWQTGNVTTMQGMFQEADTFNQNIGGWNTGFVTNMSAMFSGCNVFNQNIGAWNVSSVISFATMFSGALAFNNAGFAMPWSNGFSPLATTMQNMFLNAGVFNADIGAWTTTNVNNMSGMFSGCTAFNRDISYWNVNKVTTMQNMFANAVVYNSNLQYWNANGSCNFSNMWSGATQYIASYFNKQFYYTVNNFQPDSASYFNQIRPERYPCFMRGTQIMCYRAEEEVYLPIEDLRKGDLVKTFRNGYLPIHMIGTSSLSNPGDAERTTGRLYKCSKELYPGLFDDLYITGCHSILVPALTEDQWENTKDMLGDVYVTDNHFRLMACLDEKAQPFQKNSFIDIFHIALENEDYYMNYGVYANGLLVESCSKRYLTELSNMRIIGEETACSDPQANVFSMMGNSIQIC